MEKKFIVGVYDDEDTLIEAVKDVHEKKYKIMDVFTPYPIHELNHILHLKSRFTYAAFIYGFLGAAAVLAFLYYTAVIDWPMNYGGKPSNAFPSFIVVTLILTIFITTLSSLFTFSWRAKLFPGKKPVVVDQRATDDKFVIAFHKSDIENFEELESVLKSHGASEVFEKGEDKYEKLEIPWLKDLF